MVQNKLIILLLLPTALLGQTRFIPSTYVADDRVGSTVCGLNNEIIIGANYQKVGTAIAQGAVYVFDIATNTQKQKLTASDGAATDYFGTNSTVDNNTLVISAPGDNNTSTDAGSVYIFYKNQNGNSSWVQKKKIPAVDDIGYANFGFNVVAKNDVLAVGAKVTLGGFSARGAVYVFEKDNGGADNWGLLTTLAPSDPAANLFFGSSGTYISGSRSIAFGETNEILFIGASGRSSNRGAVYVFKKVSGTWTQTQILTASDNAVGDNFGTSVSYYGGFLFVGAPAKSSYAGKVYIFEDISGTWTQTGTILPSNPTTNARFGQVLKASLNRVLISAPTHETEGVIYDFSKDVCGTNTWTQKQKLTADSPVGYYGNSLDIFGELILIGAYLSDYDSKTDVGAAFKL